MYQKCISPFGVTYSEYCFPVSGCGILGVGVVYWVWVWYTGCGCGILGVGVVYWVWVWYTGCGCGKLGVGTPIPQYTTPTPSIPHPHPVILGVGVVYWVWVSL